MNGSRTLPDHSACSAHQRYFLSCRDYEVLLAESAQLCQICRFPSSEMPQRKLYIDHDYRGYWAVRGLLCIRCNSALGRSVARRPHGAAQYLDGAWFIRKCAERGLDLRSPPELPVGVTIEDHLGVRWTRRADGRWWPDRKGRQCRDWNRMYRHCGPLNLTPVPALVGSDISPVLPGRTTERGVGDRPRHLHQDE